MIDASATTNIAPSKTYQLDIFTAREWVTATEPHLLDMMLYPATALSLATKQADKIATEAGLPASTDGRYPGLVWMNVYPG